MNKKELYTKLLSDELISSMGCTEPAAIAYAISYAKEQIPDKESIQEINFYGSSNVLKNVLCVNIPNTRLSGIKTVILLAITKCKSKDKLNVLSHIKEQDIKKLHEENKKVKINIHLKENVNPLYIEAILKTKNHNCKVIMEQRHDVIKYCEVDKEIILKNEIVETSPDLLINLSFDDIYDYIVNREYDKKIIETTKKYNYDISEYGLKNDVGLNIGSILEKTNIYNSEYSSMIAATVSGIDSRMGGIPKKVIINNGSGNQGITATVPIVEYAKTNHIPKKIEEDALALSHLIALYIRKNQGKLSSSCGAVCASAGVAAGLSYMSGCNKKQIEGAINNLLCSSFGIFCDGAKVTCSLKVASLLSAAINASNLAKNDIYLHDNYGVILSSLDGTIKSLGNIEKQLTSKLDKVIMEEAIKARGCNE